MHTMCRGRLQKQPHIGAQSVRRPSRLRGRGAEVGLPTLFPLPKPKINAVKTGCPSRRGWRFKSEEKCIYPVVHRISCKRVEESCGNLLR